jgi:hypothetical protein
MVHAFLYALDLQQHGHTVWMILEGAATRKVRDLYLEEGMFQKLFNQIKSSCPLAGACRTASHGCRNSKTASVVREWLKSMGVGLLEDLDMHAGITSWGQDGKEIITF